MARMSNRDRIQRAAEEAQAAASERAAKSTAKPAGKSAGKSPSKPATKRTKAPERMKIVWEVCTGGGAVVETFPFAEKAAAEAMVEKLTQAGRTHVLRPTKVPMEQGE